MELSSSDTLSYDLGPIVLGARFVGILRARIAVLETKLEKYEEQNDEYLDISACDPTYTKKDGTVSTELCVAGGGSRAWSYFF